MTNPRNLSLFVDLLNKLLYFVDKGEDIVDIKKEQIEDVIELIKGHVRTIKNVPGEDDISYLDEIEKYFNNTLKVIEKRKKEKKRGRRSKIKRRTKKKCVKLNKLYSIQLFFADSPNLLGSFIQRFDVIRFSEKIICLFIIIQIEVCVCFSFKSFE